MREIDPIRHAALAALAHDPLTVGVPAEPQPETDLHFRNWRWLIDRDGIGWALLDKPGSSVNTLSEEVLSEFDALLGLMEQLQPKGLAIRSLKPSGFIAGAEIREFADMVDEQIIAERIGKGLAVLDRLEGLPFPSVALIHGFCLGGGLELALAAGYRIATREARLGFPEVMLGLHPGLGGTWRSLRIADPVAAMTMMVGGSPVSADRARRAGLVDAVTEERHFATALRQAVAGKVKKNRVSNLVSRAAGFAPARSAMARRMRSEAEQKARPAHYPAPYAMIELFRDDYGNWPAMRREETRSFAHLMVGETSHNLVRCFFLREKLKSYAKGLEHGINRVHVVGAGVMGGDIAAVAALRGFLVTLEDREPRLIAPAIGRANKLFERRIRNEGDRRAALDRLTPDPAGSGLASADLVIEAVPERVEIKAQVFARCEAAMRPDAILATNTSALLLETLMAGLKRPERFCGVHFFNPVPQMPLVEIVEHGGFDAGVRGRVLSFITALDKLPLPVKSRPGFLVNRVLTPYLMEAFIAYSEGVKPEVIDQAAVDFGMPMGPLELADTVGLDVALHVAENLKNALPNSFPEIPDWFRKLAADGKLGKKTGKGIYQWKDDKPVRQRPPGSPDLDLEDRLILPLVNAAVECLGERIVEDVDAVDAGLVFGAGFPPFRGGPIHYAEARGVGDVLHALRQLQTRYGARFGASLGWEALMPK